MTASLIQRMVLRAYRQPLINRLLHTDLGSRLFVYSYDLYKDLLEVPGNSALAHHIVPGSWAIDVGANIGFFTKRFSIWASPGGRVIAIEPDVQNLGLLRKRLKEAGIENVDVQQAVAMERSGIVRLQRNPDHPGDHKIGILGDEVAAVTIDQLVELAGSPMIGLIKVDTQGSEHRVLAGASKTLQRCRPNLFIEIDDGALRANGLSAAQLISKIQALGYQLFKIARNGREIPLQDDTIIEAIAAAKHGYVDVLCIPSPDIAR